MALDGDSIPWRVFLAETTRRLEGAAVETPQTDAERLVEHVVGYRGAELALHLDEPATRLGVTRLRELADRRATGEPLQYVLGEWSFRTLDLYLDRRVLIPRPETEVVVEHALEAHDELATLHDSPLLAVDLGTGSGAIALSLAVERPRLEVIATDRSVEAVGVARANLGGIGRPATRVRLETGSWFTALPADVAGHVHLLVSNPPYVAADDPLPAEVRHWEPTEALVAGPTGLEAVEHLVAEAPMWLASPGVFVCELAPHQADDARSSAATAGFERIEIKDDLNGRARVLVAWRR